jgi:hypothetical protein
VEIVIGTSLAKTLRRTFRETKILQNACSILFDITCIEVLKRLDYIATDRLPTDEDGFPILLDYTPTDSATPSSSAENVCQAGSNGSPIMSKAAEKRQRQKEQKKAKQQQTKQQTDSEGCKTYSGHPAPANAEEPRCTTPKRDAVPARGAATKRSSAPENPVCGGVGVTGFAGDLSDVAEQRFLQSLGWPWQQDENMDSKAQSQ